MRRRDGSCYNLCGLKSSSFRFILRIVLGIIVLCIFLLGVHLFTCINSVYSLDELVKLEISLGNFDVAWTELM